jgi:Flp pilus assembly pilin Flp
MNGRWERRPGTLQAHLRAFDKRVEALRALFAHTALGYREERAQAMVEYALILALVTAVAVVGLALIPNFPVRVFQAATNAFP